MAVKVTHKALECLTDASYSKEMAETLPESLGESRDDIATKSYLAELRSDIKEVQRAIKSDLREFELRMRLHLYAVAIVVIGVLAALELIPR